MKNKLILFCLILLSSPCFGQSLKLENILGPIYFSENSKNRIDTLYLNYVVASSIGFIDTEKTRIQYPIRIDYLYDDKVFEKKLDEGKELSKLAIRIDKLLGDSIVMTIDIKKTSKSLYFGNSTTHFYTFYDKTNG